MVWSFIGWKRIFVLEKLVKLVGLRNKWCLSSEKAFTSKKILLEGKKWAKDNWMEKNFWKRDVNYAKIKNLFLAHGRMTDKERKITHMVNEMVIAIDKMSIIINFHWNRYHIHYTLTVSLNEKYQQQQLSAITHSRKPPMKFYITFSCSICVQLNIRAICV